MLLKNKVNTTNKLNIVLCNTMHFGLPIPYFAELFWLSNTAKEPTKRAKKVYILNLQNIYLPVLKYISNLRYIIYLTIGSLFTLFINITNKANEKRRNIGFDE